MVITFLCRWALISGDRYPFFVAFELVWDISMERQHSNVGNFIFQHKEPEKDENKNKVLDISASDKERLVPVHDNCIDDKVRMSSSAKLSRAPLNYSQALMMIEILNDGSLKKIKKS